MCLIFLFASAWSVYHEYYRGGFKKTINIDGIGYNAYLPALLIHDQNLSWDCYNRVLEKSPALENQLQDFRKTTASGKFVNKYPPGLAITQLPFWTIAWAYYGFSRSISGYEMPFQIAVFSNNLFWLLLGLWLFSLFLIKKGCSGNRVLLINLILLFCTNLFHFITFDNCLTHPVTLGFSLAAFYFLEQYRSSELRKYWLIFLGILVLLFLLRPPNILMIPLFVCYYLWADGKLKIPRSMDLLTAILFAFLAVFIYLGDLKLQTGKWLVYSYQNEKFVFNQWHFWDVLAGYRCGMFLYTPVWLLIILFWFKNPNKRLIVSFGLGLVLVTYLISSWSEFCYGCRLGNRPMIDYYGFLIVPLAGVKLNLKKYQLWIIAILLVFFLYYNQILHYQYRHYLLDWCDVKKEQFWNIFLQTHRPH